MLQHYFYPAVAIETSDPLAVMQPLSEALHHRLPLTTHGAGGRYFGQSAIVAGDNPALQDSLAWGDRQFSREGDVAGGEDSSVSEPWSLQPITQPCRSLSPRQERLTPGLLLKPRREALSLFHTAGATKGLGYRSSRS